MAKRGPDFYDDASVFARYQAKRAYPFNANATLEKPVFDGLVGPLRGLRILELGCGDGQFGVEAVQQGCRAYVGVEGSRNMFALAQNALSGTEAKVVLSTIEGWTYRERQFDLVAARMALHYLEDVTAVFGRIYRALSPGGRFVFSVEHPVLTSCDRAYRLHNLRQEWIVDDYFDTGRREVSWMGAEVVKFHRTVEDYFGALRHAGFEVDALRESRPRREAMPDEETYRRRKRIPLMLFFRARRPWTGPEAA